MDIPLSIENLDQIINFENAELQHGSVTDNLRTSSPATLHFQELFALAARTEMKPLSGEIIRSHQHRSGLIDILPDKTYILKGYAAITEERNYKDATFDVLGGVIVHPNYRGAGFAKLLIANTLDSFFSDTTKLQKNIFARCNEHSRPLFEQFGFVFQETHADNKHVMTMTR